MAHGSLSAVPTIESGTYLLYDCACGTGGMLTVAEETLQQIAKAHGKQVATHLYGHEINGGDLRYLLGRSRSTSGPIGGRQPFSTAPGRLRLSRS